MGREPAAGCDAPPNAAIFYSGPGNYLKATSFAEQSGGANMTIEMTAGGQQLLSDPDFQSLNRDQQYEVFRAASAPFASGASGTANLFVNGASLEGTYITVEAPILSGSPSIIKSVYHY